MGLSAFTHFLSISATAVKKPVLTKEDSIFRSMLRPSSFDNMTDGKADRIKAI